MDINLTIGIPIYNEEKNIRKLLTQICKVVNDCSIEIIVVSSGSTDRSNEIIRTFSNIELIIEKERKGKISAIKEIITHAKGENIILIDGDVSIDENTLPNLFKEMAKECFQACTAQVQALKIRNSFMYKLSYVSCLAWHKARIEAEEGGEFVYPSGYLFAFRKRVIKNLRMQTRVINDDALIGLLLHDEGVLFKYCSNSIVYIIPPATIKDFFQQKIRTRLGRRQLIQYRQVLRIIEANWRKKIIKQKTVHLYIYAFILLVFDFIARMIANIKFSYRNNGDHHLWKQITSTK